MTRLLTLGLFLLAASLSGAAVSQETEPCDSCASKAFSDYRGAVYVEKALDAKTPEEKKTWLMIALRFDPDNADAKRLLGDLNKTLPPY